MNQTKHNCEKCAVVFDATIPIYACSYNCSYCETCTIELKYICPNCSGQLKLKTI